MSEFSADVDEILASSVEMRRLMHLGKEMGKKFEEGTSEYEGCWGVPGGADEFANAVVPQVEKTKEALAAAAGAADGVMYGLVESFGADSKVIQGSQDAALADIQQRGGGSGDVRR